MPLVRNLRSIVICELGVVTCAVGLFVLLSTEYSLDHDS